MSNCFLTSNILPMLYYMAMSLTQMRDLPPAEDRPYVCEYTLARSLFSPTMGS